MVLRVLLGVFESIISPGFSLITGLWYKPSEHSLRHGIWFAGNGVATIFGGVLGYAIGKINDRLAAWRWLFIIFGLITFTWSLVLMFFLPDSALTTRWLTPHEREIAHIGNATKLLKQLWIRRLGFYLLIQHLLAYQMAGLQMLVSTSFKFLTYIHLEDLT
jgi:MFS family permease